MTVGLLGKYFPDLSDDKIARFNRMMPIYGEWNSKINLISRKDFENFELHHLLHSLGIGKVIDFSPGTSILDAGTGGGFPGIPLAVMFPESRFILVDSIRKKTEVVRAVASELELENIEVICSRVEDLNLRVDFVVSRAVTDFTRFVGWTMKLINRKSTNRLQNGILYLKGGELSEELAPFSPDVKIYQLKEFFNEDFFTEKRVVYLPLR